MNSLEKYFDKFRRNVVGVDYEHQFACGKKPIVYADWAASGRLYRPIEKFIVDELGPYVANTHTQTTTTGTIMTRAYRQAYRIIKKHVNASDADVLLFAGFGMTAVINKFQRILGLRVPDRYKSQISEKSHNRPLVIITHMEHHSNQTTWDECICDVEIINRTGEGLPDFDHLMDILKANKNRRQIIGSFTACSNVTGIWTPYHEMAEMLHQFGGVCFIDFSASAPYVDIDMHPDNEKQALDAVFFSPHKFLGGPGSSGVIVFNRSLYRNPVPDHPGGGTVTWTNPWGGHRFFNDIEIREDGGTPGFLQGIKAGLSVLLKEEMGIEKILHREHALKDRLINQFLKINAIEILEKEQINRIGYISFFSPGIHHNLFVKLLNDRFGIQARGGCSCAGTYGHILLHITQEESRRITNEIDQGDLTCKPGWIRIAVHPTTTDKEVDFVVHGIEEVIRHHKTWQKNYSFDKIKGEFESNEKTEMTIDIEKHYPDFSSEFEKDILSF